MKGSPNSIFNWEQVNATITHFVMAVDKNAMAQSTSSNKEHTSKGRMAKMPEWIQKMVINASEPTPEGTTDKPTTAILSQTA